MQFWKKELMVKEKIKLLQSNWERQYVMAREKSLKIKTTS